MEHKHDVLDFVVARMEFEKEAEVVTMRTRCSELSATKKSASELENGSLDEFQKDLCDAVAIEGDSPNIKGNASDATRLKTDSRSTLELKSEISDVTGLNNDLCDEMDFHSKKFSVAEIEIDSSVKGKLQFDSTPVLSEADSERDGQNQDLSCSSSVINIAADGLCCEEAQNLDLIGKKESSLVNGCTDDKVNPLLFSDSETSNNVSVEEERNFKDEIEIDSFVEVSSREEKGWQLSESVKNSLKTSESTGNMLLHINRSANPLPKQVNEADSKVSEQTDESARNFRELHCHEEVGQEETLADSSHPVVSDFTAEDQSWTENELGVNNKSSTICNKVKVLETSDKSGDDELCCSGCPVVHAVICDDVPSVCTVQSNPMSASQKLDAEMGIDDDDTVSGNIIKVSRASDFHAQVSSAVICRAALGENGAGVVRPLEISGEERSSVDLPVKAIQGTDAARNMDTKYLKCGLVELDSKTERRLESASEANNGAAVSYADSCVDDKALREVDIRLSPPSVSKEMQDEEACPEIKKARSVENLSLFVRVGDSDLDKNSDSQQCSAVGVQCVGESDDNVQISDSNSNCQSAFIQSSDSQPASEATFHSERQSVFGAAPNSESQFMCGIAPDCQSESVPETVSNTENQTVFDCLHSSQLEPLQEKSCERIILEKSTSKDQPVSNSEDGSKDELVSNYQSVSKVDPNSKGHSCSKAVYWSEPEPISQAPSGVECQSFSADPSASRETQTQSSSSVASLLPLSGEGVIADISAKQESEVYYNTINEMEVKLKRSEDNSDILNTHQKSESTTQLTSENDGCCSKMKKRDPKTTDDDNESPFDTVTAKDGMHDQMTSERQDETSLAVVVETVSPQVLTDKIAEFVSLQVKATKVSETLVKADEDVKPDETGQMILSQLKPDEAGTMILSQVKPSKADGMILDLIQHGEAAEMIAEVKDKLSLGQAEMEDCSTKKDAVQSNSVLEVSTHRTQEQRSDSDLSEGERELKSPAQQEELKSKHLEFSSEPELKQEVLQVKELEQDKMLLQQERGGEITQYRESDPVEVMLKQDKDLGQNEKLCIEKDLGQIQELAEEQETSEVRQDKPELLEGNKSECQSHITNETNSVDIQQTQECGEESKLSEVCKSNNVEVEQKQLLRKQQELENERELRREIKHATKQELIEKQTSSSQEQDLMKEQELEQEREQKQVYVHEIKREKESEVQCTKDDENEYKSLQKESSNQSDGGEFKESSRLNLSCNSRCPEVVELQNLENSSNVLEMFSEENFGMPQQTGFKACGASSSGRRQRRSVPVSGKSVTTCISDEKSTVDVDHVVGAGGSLAAKKKKRNSTKKNLHQVSKEKNSVADATDEASKEPKQETTKAVRYKSSTVQSKWPVDDGRYQSDVNDSHVQRDEGEQPVALELVQVVDESRCTTSFEGQYARLFKATSLASEAEEGLSGTKREPTLRNSMGSIDAGEEKSCNSVIALQGDEANEMVVSDTYSECQSVFEKESSTMSSVVNSADKDDKSPNLCSELAIRNVAISVDDVQPVTVRGLGQMYDEKKGKEENLKRTELEPEKVKKALSCGASDAVTYGKADATTLCCRARSGGQVVRMGNEERVMNKTMTSRCMVTSFDQSTTDDGKESDGEAVLEIDLAEVDNKNESEKGMSIQGLEYDTRKIDSAVYAEPERKSALASSDTFKFSGRVVSGGQLMSEDGTLVLPQVLEADVKKVSDKKEKGRLRKRKRQKISGREADQQTESKNFEEDVKEKEDHKVNVELKLEAEKTIPVAGFIPEAPIPGNRDTPAFDETLTTLQQRVCFEPATAMKKKAKRKPKVNKAGEKTQSDNIEEPFQEGGLRSETFQMDFLKPVASLQTLQSQLPSIPMKDTSIETKPVSDSLSSIATSTGNTTPDSKWETTGSMMRPLWEKMCLEDNSLPDPSFSSIRQLEACVKAISTNLQKRVTNSVSYRMDTFPPYHPEVDLGRRWLTLPEFGLTNGDPSSGTIGNMGTGKFSGAKRKTKGKKDRKDQQNVGWPIAEHICDGAKTAEDLCGGIDKLPWLGPKQRGKKKSANTSSMESSSLNNTELVGLSKESDASSSTIKTKPRNRKSRKNSACGQLNLPSSEPLALEVDPSLASPMPTDFSKNSLKISLENCNTAFSPSSLGNPMEQSDPLSPKGHRLNPNGKSRTKRPKKNSKITDESKEISHPVKEIQNSDISTWPVNTSDSNTSMLMNQTLEKTHENQTVTEPAKILDRIVAPEQGTAKCNQELSQMTAVTDATLAKPLKRKKPSKCAKDAVSLALIEAGSLVERPAEEVPAKKKKSSKKVRESEIQLELIGQSSITNKLPAKSKSPAKCRRKRSANVDAPVAEERPYASVAEEHQFGMDNVFMSQEKVIVDQEVLSSNENPPKPIMELPSERLPAKHFEHNFNKVAAILDNFTRPDSQTKSSGKSAEEEKEPVSSVTPDMRSTCDTTDSEHPGEKSKAWSGDAAIKESKPGLNSSSDLKPFSCPQCSYHAKKKGQLRKHLGVHRIYSCAHCDFASGSHDELDTHMLAKHPSRCGRKLCKKCHVLFRMDALISHERDCTGEKRGWDCEVCGKKFKFVSAMRTHLKRWHSSDSSIQADGNDEDEEHLCKEGFEDNPGTGKAPSSTIPQPNQSSSPFQTNEESSRLVTKPTIPANLCDKPISPNQLEAEPCSSTQPCDQPSGPTQQSDESSSTTPPCNMPSSSIQPGEKPSSSKSFDSPSSTTQPCDSPSSCLDPSEKPSSPFQIAEKSSSPLQPSEKLSVQCLPCDQLSSPSQTGNSPSHFPESCDRLSSPHGFSINPSFPLESAKPTSDSLIPAKPKKKRKSAAAKPTIEKPFFCSVCEKHFKSKKTLKSHSQTKHGFKPDLSACCISASDHLSAAEVLPAEVLPAEVLPAEVLPTVPDNSKESEEMACMEKILPKSPVEELPSINLTCFFQECGRQFKKVEQLHRHEEKHAGWKEFTFTLCSSFYCTFSEIK